ncbi:MAG: hypothetical protein WCC86_09265 [Methanoregula sp.]|uniref:hypothetical protein n=1 Tax=Methanoregula sp. TaxID=2052170 RepID=UPI003BB062B4
MQSRIRYTVIPLAVLLLAATFAGCTSNNTPVASQNAPTPAEAGFITAANACTDTNITVIDDVGTMRYASSPGCVFTKTLVSLNATETQEMKSLLEGKSMTCMYTKGNFDPQLVTSLVGGMENCTGDLKDDIGNLVIFT